MYPIKVNMHRLIYLLIHSTLICLLHAYTFTPSLAEAFPSATTTGITEKDCPNWNERKTNTRGRTISTDGAVIDYENISGGGGLRIEAKNVTIRCVKIDAKFSDLYGINCFTRKGCAGLLVEHVDISNCKSACATALGAPGNPSIWRQIHLHNSQKDLLKIEGNTILEDSYLHGYAPVSGSHNDAIQTSRGSNIVVRNNRIEGPWRNQTSAYIVKTDAGPVSNLRIENNLLSGGTFTLYLYDGGHGIPTKVVVRDNVWVKNSYKFGSYGVHTKASTCFEWSNNRFDDNSSLSPPPSVSPNGSCGSESGGPREPDQASTPNISPDGGDFTAPVTVEIGTSEDGATVYYTLNDSTPTERSSVYQEPFELSSSATVKAITVKDGMDSSSVREATFHINDFVSTSKWQSVAFDEQTEAFTVEFDVTPSADTIDGVTGLSAVAASGYSDLAAIIRFYKDGRVDARNGSTYQAEQPLAYIAGARYFVLLTVDPVSHVYSATVTPEDGTPVLIADNYAFRTEQSSVSALSMLSMYTTNGTHRIENFLIGEPNQAPIADAGGDLVVPAGETTIFNGSGSFDPDGDTLSYEWDFGDGHSDTGMTVEHVYADAGDYTVTLTVSDGFLFDTHAVNITVETPALSFFEDFETYGSGEDPFGWKDTEDQNSQSEDQRLFKTAQIGGTMAFGTTSLDTNIHTHYGAVEALDWTNYTYSGRMYLSDRRGGLGVTFFSQYPARQDRYYRLRRYDVRGQRDFHLSPHGTSVSGTTHSGVIPEANTWYRFRIEVTDLGDRTEIRAKVWREGVAEPSGFQIEATDASADRLRSGTVGLWSMSNGGKYFDELQVHGHSEGN